ncbi:hypothetical protein GALL_471300 [mine drainage metagenome]|uniref:Uncharacterized protein n=1 Tax=mine drainage metagenome TaxID=410659 RepID=A0A1J5PI29_9ZZZZ
MAAYSSLGMVKLSRTSFAFFNLTKGGGSTSGAGLTTTGLTTAGLTTAGLVGFLTTGFGLVVTASFLTAGFLLAAGMTFLAAGLAGRGLTSAGVLPDSEGAGADVLTESSVTGVTLTVLVTMGLP